MGSLRQCQHRKNIKKTELSWFSLCQHRQNIQKTEPSWFSLCRTVKHPKKLNYLGSVCASTAKTSKNEFSPPFSLSSVVTFAVLARGFSDVPNFLEFGSTRPSFIA